MRNHVSSILLALLTLHQPAPAGPLMNHTDVFTSGTDGYHTFRIPAIETAPDGSLVAFAEARKHSQADPGFGKQDIDLVCKRSGDGGLTWSPMKIIEDPGELWSAANPVTVVDRKTRRVWVLYIRSRPGRSTVTSRPGTDDMQTMARWSDDGVTWSEPIDLTKVARDMGDPQWRASVVGPGGAIQNRKGRLVVPAWKVAPWGVFTVHSDDSGQTWHRGKLVPGGKDGNENQLVELGDGRILMDIRQSSGPHRWIATSGDGGTTWSEPRPGLPVTPVACAIERYTLKSSGDDRDRILWTGPKGPGRTRLVVCTSYDEGETFTNERLIWDQHAAYSDITILGDRTVGVLWERGVKRGYEFITFTRFNLEFLEPSPRETGEQAAIHVKAGQVIGSITRTMTGACIEDVNHEIYGGLYSQMVFGESFQEPPPPPEIPGFTAVEGDWHVKDGVVHVGRFPGPKLISDHPESSSGRVGVEVYLPGRTGGVAGLIVKVREAGRGMDNFFGYEVALDSERQVLVLGRHRKNWEPIRNIPCEVPVDRWIPLEVRTTETSLEVSVDGKLRAEYTDGEHPLRSGRVGLRPFQRECRYRSFWIETDGKRTDIRFESVGRWGDGVSRMWRPLRRGTATGRFDLEPEDPFAGVQSQRVEFIDGDGEIGIENQGLNRWGMHIVEGKPYEGYVWARADATPARAGTPAGTTDPPPARAPGPPGPARKPVTLHVSLQSRDGSRVYDETRVDVTGDRWHRLDFTLTPDGTDIAGRLAVILKSPGAAVLGHVFLQPGEWGRFRGLPVRRDVAEALIEQGLTVLRYGGSMINAAEYRWKKMVGPRDRRPPYRGTWYPYSTNGWGIIDFLDFCEAAGFVAIPAFNMDETPQDMADFVEYVNGPLESPWGRRRAAGGHPEPYRLRHIELGNEEAIDDDYWQRFKPKAEAIWAKDPDLTVVGGDFAYNGRIQDPYDFGGAPRIRSLAVHRKILELAEAHHRPVWFDVHVWNHEPRDPDELRGGIIGLRDFIAALGRISPGAGYKVCVFEENAVNHTLRRGLGHAHAINELERSGSMVPIVCAANCLQPYGQNDNGWDQGMLFLTSSQVWGQPSYYVTQMVSRNHLPLCIHAEVKSPKDALDVTAKKSEDGRTIALQVVNLEGDPVTARIEVEGFAPARPEAAVLEIAGQLGDENTPEDPERIRPARRQWRHGLGDGPATYTFPPYSFTILRLE